MHETKDKSPPSPIVYDQSLKMLHLVHLLIDQIINNAAKIRQMSGGQFKCPIVFRGPTGSAGQLGATHSQAFENWFAKALKQYLHQFTFI